MKRIVPIFVVFLFGLWLGCGGDEEGPTDNGGKPLRLVANTTVNEPTLDSVNDPVWSTVDSIVVPVSQANRPKLRPPQTAAVPPNVTVKAIKKSSKLYLRLQWSDATFDAYPDHFEVNEIDPISTPQTVRFDQHDHALTEEDQIFVMFYGLPEGGYDVWNWRVLTIGGAGLGKGYTYTGTALIEDAAGTSTDPVAVKNDSCSIVIGPDTISYPWPAYAHKDTSDYDHYILYLTDVISCDSVIDSVYDEQMQEWLPVHFYNTTGWEIGDTVPGWIIDSSFASQSKEEQGSRWDIKAVSDYNDGVGEYHVVLCRELNTGFNDDMDLSVVDSVKVKIGIYDSQDKFGELTADRGFSDEFWIILP